MNATVSPPRLLLAIAALVVAWAPAATIAAPQEGDRLAAVSHPLAVAPHAHSLATAHGCARLAHPRPSAQPATALHAGCSR